jgi:predicted RNase H-like HicB family nuclease
MKRDQERSRMRFYTFAIVVEKEPGTGGYSAWVPSLAGCFRREPTLERALRSVHAALEERVASLVALDQPMPGGETLVHVSELTIALPERAEVDGESS